MVRHLHFSLLQAIVLVSIANITNMYASPFFPEQHRVDVERHRVARHRLFRLNVLVMTRMSIR